jgi:hypothetical protein
VDGFEGVIQDDGIRRFTLRRRYSMFGLQAKAGLEIGIATISTWMNRPA